MDVNWLSLLGLDAWLARWRANMIEGAIAAEDRLDLARLEWQDQKRRIFSVVVMGIALGGLTVVALVVFSMALVVQFWDTPQRLTVAWSVSAAWLLLWGGLLLGLISTLRKAGNAFALTRNELAQDWHAIKERL